MSWLDRRPWLLALIVVLVVAVPGYVRMEQIANQQGEMLECVRDWADATTERSERLTAINEELLKARDAVFSEMETYLRDITNPARRAQADIRPLVEALRHRSEVQRRQEHHAERYAVPPPPGRICGTL